MRALSSETNFATRSKRTTLLTAHVQPASLTEAMKHPRALVPPIEMRRQRRRGDERPAKSADRSFEFSEANTRIRFRNRASLDRGEKSWVLIETDRQLRH
jgi:hypothetical protein